MNQPEKTRFVDRRSLWIQAQQPVQLLGPGAFACFDVQLPGAYLSDLLRLAEKGLALAQGLVLGLSYGDVARIQAADRQAGRGVASWQNTHREPVQSVGKLRRIFNLVFEAGDAVGVALSESCLWLPVIERGVNVLGERALSHAMLEAELDRLLGIRLVEERRVWKVAARLSDGRPDSDRTIQLVTHRNGECALD